MTRIQLRGHCQCCGAIQAVVKSNKMSKHGYTVADGWFKGVCTGDRFQPMEQSISQTTAIVAAIRIDVAQLQEALIRMKAGEIKPEWIAVPLHMQARVGAERIPFISADKYTQDNAVQSMIYATEGRIRSGISFAKDMEALAAKTIGQPLQEVSKDKSDRSPILNGEVRQSTRHVLIATRVAGPRVYYKTKEGGFEGWIGTGAWRKLEIVKEN